MCETLWVGRSRPQGKNETFLFLPEYGNIYYNILLENTLERVPLGVSTPCSMKDIENLVNVNLYTPLRLAFTMFLANEMEATYKGK